MCDSSRLRTGLDNKKCEPESGQSVSPMSVIRTGFRTVIRQTLGAYLFACFEQHTQHSSPPRCSPLAVRTSNRANATEKAPVRGGHACDKRPATTPPIGRRLFCFAPLKPKVCEFANSENHAGRLSSSTGCPIHWVRFGFGGAGDLVVLGRLPGQTRDRNANGQWADDRWTGRGPNGGAEAVVRAKVGVSLLEKIARPCCCSDPNFPNCSRAIRG